MRHSHLQYIVIAVMLVSGLYVAVTGLIADRLGLHQFAFHRHAGYLCAGFAFLHLILNGRRAVRYLRRLARQSPASSAAVGPKRGEGPSIGRRQILTAAISATGGLLIGRLLPGRQQELPGEASDIGALYHEWSTPNQSLGFSLPSWGGRPPRYKTYPDADRIALPDPRGFQGLTVADALEARRSVRDYSNRPLSLEELSRLAYAAQGITEQGREFRAAPSAGALYPIELYPLVHSVSGLAPGIYHYAVREHALELLERGDLRGSATEAGLRQHFLGQASVCFVLTAVFQRTRWKYRERAYRYVLMEAGHVCQNLYLAATSMGLGACAVGAFYDQRFNELLGLSVQEEGVLYVVTAGEPV